MYTQKILTTVLICLIVAFTQAQPRLVALTSEGGNNSAGTIIQYVGGDTAVSRQVSLAAGNPQNMTLVQAPDGKFYGTLSDGVAGDTDILITYDYVTNTYTRLAGFNSSTGVTPAGALLLVNDSMFYGLAYAGGANNSGTIYSYTIGSNTLVKHADLPAGAYPYGALMQAADGKLYGLTQNDCTHHSGTIFSYDMGTMVYAPLFNLPTYAHPLGGLVEATPGVLYGLTFNDSINHCGSLFSFNIADSIYAVQYYFTGSHSNSSLMQASDGLLYGLLSDGGIYSTGLYNGGMLFSYNPQTGLVDTLHSFGNGADGNYPLDDLMEASDGNIYGATNSGGTAGQGTIFQYNLHSQTYKLMVNLNAGTGYFPGYGHLSEFVQAPVIYAQPAAAIVCADSLVTFTVADSGTGVHVQWQVSTNGGNSYTNIAGANADTLTLTGEFSLNGNLYRTLVSGLWATDTSAAAMLTVDSCTATGINSLPAITFAIYPNPVGNRVTIQQNYAGGSSLLLVNTLGQQIKSFRITAPQQQLDVSDLAPGIYQLKLIQSNSVLAINKLVKQ
jgi:uncharacterized repeat protein (TIGR03803 family)